MNVVILGAGIAGHAAAQHLRRWLPRNHDVHVVSPKTDWNWIPSNIWVGVGRMKPEQTLVPLAPLYRKLGIEFTQARAAEIHPEGGVDAAGPYVAAESTLPESAGRREIVPYDFLINATGPKLNFAATPGLGPDTGNSVSVCTADHAAHAAREFLAAVERMKGGQKQTFVVGVGHGNCTCEGAAFEYVFNVEFELRRHGVRDKARIIYLTNEAQIGDFGVGGLHLKMGGYVTHSKVFAESLFAERGVEWISGAHVHRVEKGRLQYETLAGAEGALEFDFAMLLPPFRGVDLKAFAKDGTDLTAEMFASSGFMKVDADYTPKPYEAWKAADWPQTYQAPGYPNLFAVGIAFAPPHPISRPRTSPKGTSITPAPPRTGMPSGVMGVAAAMTVRDRILVKPDAPAHRASLAKLGAACVASAGTGILKGSAASMTMYPIVPDYERFPEYGRELDSTFGEIGSAGHWIKRLLHTMFIYKAKSRPLWWLIPE